MPGREWADWPSLRESWGLTLIAEEVVAGSRCNTLVTRVAVQQFIDALEDVLHGHAPGSTYRGVANRLTLIAEEVAAGSRCNTLVT